MTVKGPRVRDFTSGGSDLSIDVVSGEVYETLAALYAVPESVDGSVEYDDPDLLERLSARLDDATATAIESAGDTWGMYFGLLGLAYDTGLGASMAEFVEHLRGMDPLDVRLAMLVGACMDQTDQAVIDAAVAGDGDAVDTLLGGHHGGLRSVLGKPAGESVAFVIDVLEQFHKQALAPELPSLLPALRRDAEAKRVLGKKLTAEELAERATHGVTFEPSPGVSGVVLIPSVVLRPWALVVAHGSLRVFMYSVDEETINADPDAPPAYLIDLYKALGDERRLRLLAELWRGDIDLKTLAQKVDLAKSTVHHHLRSLRQAGLVRVVVRDDDKVYSLRKEGLADAGPLLENFLSQIQSKE